MRALAFASAAAMALLAAAAIALLVDFADAATDLYTLVLEGVSCG